MMLPAKHLRRMPDPRFDPVPGFHPTAYLRLFQEAGLDAVRELWSGFAQTYPEVRP